MMGVALRSRLARRLPPLRRRPQRQMTGSHPCKAAAAGTELYHRPSDALAAFADRPESPSLSLSPDKSLAAWIDPAPPFPSVEELAVPERRLAGLRIDPNENARSRMGYVRGASFQRFDTDSGPYGEFYRLTGISEGRINFISFSPNSESIAFAWRPPPASGKSQPPQLYRAQVKPALESGEEVVAQQILPTRQLNCIFENYSWLDDDTMLACCIPESKSDSPPQPPPAALGPKAQENSSGNVAMNVTFADLLADEHDSQTFEHFACSDLVRVPLDGSGAPHSLNSEPQLFTSADPSPDGNFLLVEYLHRPFSYLVPCGRFPKETEVWDAATGERRFTVESTPLLEHIPSHHDSTRPGKRAISWRPDKGSELVMVEAQDDGDPTKGITPMDKVYSLSVEEGEQGQSPRVLATSEMRFSGLIFGRDDLALLYEGLQKTRKSRTWCIQPGMTESYSPQLVFDRSADDAYNSPGRAVTRRTEQGTYLLATVVDDEGQENLLFQGAGASPEGQRPFMDLRNVQTFEARRIWRCAKGEPFEAPGMLLAQPGEGTLDLNGLKLLLSQETPRDNPQLCLMTLGEEGTEPCRKQITDFPHPHPHLREPKKTILTYQRDDGTNLNGSLFLPDGHDVETDGPLPTVIFAYPREYKSKDDAGQLKDSPNKFEAISPLSPLVWLAKGYAVLDGPALPIVAEGEDEEPNDTYIEQLVAGAKAAVDTLVERGISDPERIAIGGRSYGAAMAANLLAHSPDLFACAICHSGAYNRTLTPFGFQMEKRSLWEATESYLRMSPFMHANKVKKPILLIHGEEDNNPGTWCQQSERFYQALKAHGVECRLAVMPHEQHSYRGLESVLHIQYEMERWLDRYIGDGEEY